MVTLKYVRSFSETPKLPPLLRHTPLDIFACDVPPFLTLFCSEPFHPRVDVTAPFANFFCLHPFWTPPRWILPPSPSTEVFQVKELLFSYPFTPT